MIGKAVDKHIHQHGFATANPAIKIESHYRLWRPQEFFHPVLRVATAEIVNQIIQPRRRRHLRLIFGKITSGDFGG